MDTGLTTSENSVDRNLGLSKHAASNKSCLNMAGSLLLTTVIDLPLYEQVQRGQTRGVVTYVMFRRDHTARRLLLPHTLYFDEVTSQPAVD